MTEPRPSQWNQSQDDLIRPNGPLEFILTKGCKLSRIWTNFSFSIMQLLTKWHVTDALIFWLNLSKKHRNFTWTFACRLFLLAKEKSWLLWGLEITEKYYPCKKAATDGKKILKNRKLIYILDLTIIRFLSETKLLGLNIVSLCGQYGSGTWDQLGWSRLHWAAWECCSPGTQSGVGGHDSSLRQHTFVSSVPDSQSGSVPVCFWAFRIRNGLTSKKKRLFIFEDWR